METAHFPLHTAATREIEALESKIKSRELSITFSKKIHTAHMSTRRIYAQEEEWI